mmetsp:Transcript_62209/g.173825  ORF Transcript_62209/g.173825 Transcript_62209/m.173825 type:complete len:397 (+) Transcript_62209:533-1723(+)
MDLSMAKHVKPPAPARTVMSYFCVPRSTARPPKCCARCRVASSFSSDGPFSSALCDTMASPFSTMYHCGDSPVLLPWVTTASPGSKCTRPVAFRASSSRCWCTKVSNSVTSSSSVAHSCNSSSLCELACLKNLLKSCRLMAKTTESTSAVYVSVICALYSRDISPSVSPRFTCRLLRSCIALPSIPPRTFRSSTDLTLRVRPMLNTVTSDSATPTTTPSSGARPPLVLPLGDMSKSEARLAKEGRRNKSPLEPFGLVGFFPLVGVQGPRDQEPGLNGSMMCTTSPTWKTVLPSDCPNELLRGRLPGDVGEPLSLDLDPNVMVLRAEHLNTEPLARLRIMSAFIFIRCSSLATLSTAVSADLAPLSTLPGSSPISDPSCTTTKSCAISPALQTSSPH